MPGLPNLCLFKDLPQLVHEIEIKFEMNLLSHENSL